MNDPGVGRANIGQRGGRGEHGRQCTTGVAPGATPVLPRRRFPDACPVLYWPGRSNAVTQCGVAELVNVRVPRGSSARWPGGGRGPPRLLVDPPRGRGGTRAGAPGDSAPGMQADRACGGASPLPPGAGTSPVPRGVHWNMASSPRDARGRSKPGLPFILAGDWIRTDDWRCAVRLPGPCEMLWQSFNAACVRHKVHPGMRNRLARCPRKGE